MYGRWLQAKSALIQEKAALQRENQLLWAERYLIAMKLGCDPEAVNLCVAMQEWQERMARELQPVLSQQHRHALEEREAWVHYLLTQLKNQLLSPPAAEPQRGNQLTRRHDQHVPRLWRRSSGGGTDVLGGGPRLRPALSHPNIITAAAEAEAFPGFAKECMPLAKAGAALSCPLQETPQHQQLLPAQQDASDSPDSHVDQSYVSSSISGEAGPIVEANGAAVSPGADTDESPRCSSPSCASWRSTGSEVDVHQVINSS
jgi:hypothetical protein